MNMKCNGFTLIELLVVIAIVSLLSSVMLSTFNSVRAKARDAKRAADMEHIYQALNLFYTTYGCLPITSGTTCAGAAGYSDANTGGWDYSSQGSFMSFLHANGIMAQVPVDPINDMTGDGAPAGTFGYRYYCYPSGANPGLSLGYYREVNRALVLKSDRNSASSTTDTAFICK